MGEPTGSRLIPRTVTDYGMREFAVVDRSGNLLRVGSPTDLAAGDDDEARQDVPAKQQQSVIDLYSAAADMTIHPPGSPRSGLARSYLADGRMVSWSPTPVPAGVRLAVDAEITWQPVPRALAERFGISEPATFWPLWTQVEVSCKLADVPLLAWLQRHGLTADPSHAMMTFGLDDVVVTAGVLPLG